jgi:hypothetical protein
MDVLNFMIYPQLDGIEKYKNARRVDLQNPPEGWEVFVL